MIFQAMRWGRDLERFKVDEKDSDHQCCFSDRNMKDRGIKTIAVVQMEVICVVLCCQEIENQHEVPMGEDGASGMRKKRAGSVPGGHSSFQP